MALGSVRERIVESGLLERTKPDASSQKSTRWFAANDGTMTST